MSLLEKVKALELPERKYVIFGSGPMAVRGLKESHDIDILVTQEVYDEYKEKNEWEKKKTTLDEYVEKDGIELWYNWRPGEWNVKELIDNAENIDGLSFVPLGTVLEWKKISGREKDLKDIEIIEKYLSDNNK